MGIYAMMLLFIFYFVALIVRGTDDMAELLWATIFLIIFAALAFGTTWYGNSVMDEEEQRIVAVLKQLLEAKEAPTT